MLLEVIVQSILNVVNLTLHPFDCVGYHIKSGLNPAMILTVLAPELLNNSDHNAANRCDDGCNDDRPIGVHQSSF